MLPVSCVAKLVMPAVPHTKLETALPVVPCTELETALPAVPRSEPETALPAAEENDGAVQGVVVRLPAAVSEDCQPGTEAGRSKLLQTAPTLSPPIRGEARGRAASWL